ncbi:hypothetical protein Lal_00033445 [Lupinus albus]|nr:hypothetical protein Lal_00033445 [Lupinus albus]
MTRLILETKPTKLWSTCVRSTRSLDRPKEGRSEAIRIPICLSRAIFQKKCWHLYFSLPRVKQVRRRLICSVAIEDLPK